MAKEDNNRLQKPAARKYRQVEISTLDRGRRGKHHELVQGILKELEMAEAESALEIPLSDVGDIGLANLRSAVHRGASASGITIETLADEKNFYVWKQANS
jgi:hypothetical protein